MFKALSSYIRISLLVHVNYLTFVTEVSRIMRASTTCMVSCYPTFPLFPLCIKHDYITICHSGMLFDLTLCTVYITLKSKSHFSCHSQYNIPNQTNRMVRVFLSNWSLFFSSSYRCWRKDCLYEWFYICFTKTRCEEETSQEGRLCCR